MMMPIGHLRAPSRVIARPIARTVFLLLAATAHARAAAGADHADAQHGCVLCPTELSVRTAYGSANRRSLDLYAVGPHVAFDLPAVPAIAGNRVRLAAELMGAVVEGAGTTGEVALTPLLLDYRYDRGQRIVPYVEGGEGIVVTWVRGLALGGAFQFSSQVGGGLHVFLTEKWALTVGYGLRHISNAGLESPNRGLNTQFLVIGLTHFPSRGSER